MKALKDFILEAYKHIDIVKLRRFDDRLVKYDNFDVNGNVSLLLKLSDGGSTPMLLLEFDKKKKTWKSKEVDAVLDVNEKASDDSPWKKIFIISERPFKNSQYMLQYDWLEDSFKYKTNYSSDYYYVRENKENKSLFYLYSPDNEEPFKQFIEDSEDMLSGLYNAPTSDPDPENANVITNEEFNKIKTAFRKMKCKIDKISDNSIDITFEKQGSCNITKNGGIFMGSITANNFSKDYGRGQTPSDATFVNPKTQKIAPRNGKHVWYDVEDFLHEFLNLKAFNFIYD